MYGVTPTSSAERHFSFDARALMISYHVIVSHIASIRITIVVIY